MTKREKRVCVFNLTRQSFLGLEVKVADTQLTRLVGLLGRRKLGPNGGLWVFPSQGIHTVGMLFPIDLIYLDEHDRVIHAVEHLAPFRIGPLRRQCHSVLELAIRTIYTSQTEVGDELLICSAAEAEVHLKAEQALRQPAGVDSTERIGGRSWQSMRS